MKQRFIIVIPILVLLVVTFFVMTKNNISNNAILSGKTLDGVSLSVSGHDLRTIYKTNSWFSSAYQFPSNPMFVYPGAYQITKRGVGVSVPQVKSTEKTIFGSFDELCNVSEGNPILNSKIIGYGDWNVDILVGDNLKFSFVQGSPVTYLGGAKRLKFECKGALITKVDMGVLIKRDGAILLVQSKSGNNSSFESEGTFEMSSDSDQWRINILPNDSANIIEKFGNYDWNRVINTEISFETTESIKTNWAYASENNNKILTTVWPHHGKVTGTDLIENAVYKTVLGDMQLVETSGFSSNQNIPKLNFTFDKVQNESDSVLIKEAVKSDTEKILKENPPDGVYFKGTWIGSLTSLIQLSDLYGMLEERDQLLLKLETVLQKSFDDFEYDKETHLLKSKKPEFGNEFGNDHHFHYGYYIRASAVLYKFRPDSLKWSNSIVSEMINDIASFDRDKNSNYPYLRYFSAYEGHSWADGRANFADGNNQESTSEALNAWYAIKIWGDIKGDKELSSRGQWLFSQELEGTSKYWFGKNNPFPDGYGSVIASLVWGGKRDFSTWFSADVMNIIGIQFLPISPASIYLKSVGDFQKIEKFVSDKNKTPFNHEWADLYMSYISYSDPKYARENYAEVKKFDGIKLKSLYLQTIFSQK